MTEQTQPLLTDALARLRHLCSNLMNGGVRDTASAKRIAEGLLSPVIADLEKWGTPAPVGVEPAQWQKRHQLRTNGEWENTHEHDAKWWRDNSQGWEIRALYTTPQPTQAQAGAVESAEFGRFLSDVLTAAGLVTHGKQCKALGERLADMCAKLRHHGIKGGQHGTE